MQFVLNATLAIGASASVFSMLVALYLIKLWASYEKRLTTDLPLLFGISFTFHGVNTFLQTLAVEEILPESLEILRLRAIIIMLTVIPIAFGLLHIWSYRYRKHHNRVMLLLVCYWLVVTLFAPSAELLMSLLIPLMLVFILGFMVTFCITWQTGKLKEVRSDLMFFSLGIIVVSQILRIPLYSLGLLAIPALLNAVGTLIAAVAFIQPQLFRSAI